MIPYGASALGVQTRPHLLVVDRLVDDREPTPLVALGVVHLDHPHRAERLAERRHHPPLLAEHPPRRAPDHLAELAKQHGRYHIRVSVRYALIK